MKIGIIDMSGVAHKVLHGKVDPSSPELERKEYRQHFAEYMYEMITLVNADHWVLATDSRPYWRNKVYDKFYDTHCLFAIEEDSHTLYLRHDNGVWPIGRTPLGEFKAKAKCNKTTVPVELVRGLNTLMVVGWDWTKELKSLRDTLIEHEIPKTEWEDAILATKRWSPISKMDAHLKSLEASPEMIEDVTEAIKVCRPRYKGNRSSSAWEYKTPKKEWHKLTDANIQECGHVLGAKMISIAEAEADDIIAVAARGLAKSGKHEIVIMSADTDLVQLHRFKGVTQYSFHNNGWLESAAPMFETRMKVIGGDYGDNIKGCAIPGKSSCIAKGGAEKLLEMKSAGDSLKSLFPKAEKEGWLHYLKKNIELVWLECIPKNLQEKITEALKSKPLKRKGSWADMGLDSEAENVIRAKAVFKDGKIGGQ